VFSKSGTNQFLCKCKWTNAFTNAKPGDFIWQDNNGDGELMKMIWLT
jgi:hypothetical protein